MAWRHQLAKAQKRNSSEKWQRINKTANGGGENSSVAYKIVAPSAPRMAPGAQRRAQWRRQRNNQSSSVTIAAWLK